MRFFILSAMRRFRPCDDAELRKIEKMIQNPYTDWNETAIEFMCEEVLPLESLGTCFVHSYFTTYRWSENLEEAIDKTCKISRGRLCPGMFPLFEPRVLRTDFSTFVWPVHKISPLGPDSNHWSLLVLYYDEELSKHGGTSPVTFYHFDSLVDSIGNNSERARQCAVLLERYMLFGARHDRAINFVDVKSWPKQKLDDRTCGLRTCVAAWLVAHWGSSVLQRESSFEAAWELRYQHVTASGLSKIREMKGNLAWCEEVNDVGIDLACWASRGCQTTFSTVDQFLPFLRWNVDAKFAIFFFGKENRRAVGKWTRAYGRIDVYMLGYDGVGKNEREDLRNACGAHSTIVCFHTTDMEGERQRRCWIFRIIEYLIRSRDFRLLPTSHCARELVGQLPRHCVETYGATRGSKTAEARISGLIPHNGVPHSADVVRLLRICSTFRSAAWICHWLDQTWFRHRARIEAHRSVVPFIRGLDYLQPEKAGDAIVFQIRFFEFEFSRLEKSFLKYCSNRREEVPPEEGAGFWMSGEWIACVLSYLIYVDAVEK